MSVTCTCNMSAGLLGSCSSVTVESVVLLNINWSHAAVAAPACVHYVC